MALQLQGISGKTIAIVHPVDKDKKLLINPDNFDPSTMVLWEDRKPVEEPKRTIIRKKRVPAP